MGWQRIKPRLDKDNRAFWTGGAEGKLYIHKCGDCGAFNHPPRELCRNCHSENVTPEAVAGTGVVETFTINYQQWTPDMELPLVIAHVVLDGVPGVKLTTNIVGCPVAAVSVGDRVQLTFEQDGEIWFPLFKKAV